MRLAHEYQGVFSRETVRRMVHTSRARLGHVAVHEYLPILVERWARDRLRDCAQVQGLVPKTQPTMLYVCVHNSGRSQMAAALTRHLSEGRVVVRSAGSAPGSRVLKTVLTVMDEIGIDLTREFPKPLTDEAVRAADMIVTMGCGDACEVLPGRRYFDWPLEDPAGQGIDAVRHMRDNIAARVRTILAQTP